MSALCPRLNRPRPHPRPAAQRPYGDRRALPVSEMPGEVDGIKRVVGRGRVYGEWREGEEMTTFGIVFFVAWIVIALMVVAMAWEAE